MAFCTLSWLSLVASPGVIGLDSVHNGPEPVTWTRPDEGLHGLQTIVRLGLRYPKSTGLVEPYNAAQASAMNGKWTSLFKIQPKEVLFSGRNTVPVTLTLT